MVSYKKIRLRLLQFMYIQTILTFGSLPLLAFWGLPLSIMTPIGNLLFGPSLSAFLALALVLFVSEILCIPNTWLASLFSWLSHQWYRVLCWSSPRWLIGVSLHWSLVLIPFVLIVFLVTTRRKSLEHRLLHANLLIVAIVSFLHFFGHPSDSSHAFTSRKQTFLVEYHHDTVTMIDNGLLGTKQNPQSWLSFTLRPFVLQNTATLHIAHLICHKTTDATALAVCCMADSFIISRITLHTKNRKPLDPLILEKLSLAAQKHNIKLELLSR